MLTGLGWLMFYRLVLLLKKLPQCNFSCHSLVVVSLLVSDVVDLVCSRIRGEHRICSPSLVVMIRLSSISLYAKFPVIDTLFSKIISPCIGASSFHQCSCTSTFCSWLGFHGAIYLEDLWGLERSVLVLCVKKSDKKSDVTCYIQVNLGWIENCRAVHLFLYNSCSCWYYHTVRHPTKSNGLFHPLQIPRSTWRLQAIFTG